MLKPNKNLGLIDEEIVELKNEIQRTSSQV